MGRVADATAPAPRRSDDAIAAVVLGHEPRLERVRDPTGYQGLFEEDGVVALTRDSVRGITHLGGTILGTTNRDNPLSWPVERDDGTVELLDRSDKVVEEFRRRELDALIAIGGDGSLQIASALSEKGLPVVGVPKTIDNDLATTQVTWIVEQRRRR